MKTRHQRLFTGLLGIFVFSLILGCTNREKQNLSTIISADGDLLDSIDISETITGKILSYLSDSSGCLFVDPEMVKQGTAQNLNHKMRSDICRDSIYGRGIPIVFLALQNNINYSELAEEGVLIDVKGTWKIEKKQEKDSIEVFYAIEYEPFF